MTVKKFNLGVSYIYDYKQHLTEEFLLKIDGWRDKSVVEVDEETLDEFLSSTNLKLAYYVTTRKRGVYDCVITTYQISAKARENYTSSDRIPPQPVQVTTWDGSGRDYYASIAANILGPIVEKKIILSVPHGRAKEMSPRGAFQIYVWSHPDINCTKGNSTPSYMWGEAVSCTDSSFAPSRSTDPSVIISSDGHAVAEVCSNALYIYHDAVHHHDHQSEYIFSRILWEASKIIKGVDFEKIEAEREQRHIEAEKRAFDDFIKQSIPRQVSRNKEEINGLNRKIKNKEEELHSLRRDAANFNASMDHDAAIDGFKKEFEKLQNGFPMIEKVSLSGTDLEIETEAIISTDKLNDNKYHLGKMRLILGLGDIPNVRAYGLETTLDLPHVYMEDGHRICAGTVHDEINAYLANYEIAAAASLMVAFFQSGIDVRDDFGIRLLNFPPAI